MRTTPEGLQLIRDFEGLALVAYYDGGVDENGVPHGTLTIGYGHTHDVTPEMQITPEEAEDLLVKDVAEIEQMVLTMVRAPLTDNQVSALTSFAFNVGFGKVGVKDGFRYLKNGHSSSLLRFLNAMNFVDAVGEFEKWSHVNGKESAGLRKRRIAERELFMRPDGKEKGWLSKVA